MQEWVQAARALYQKLQKGTYRTATARVKPIAFDARKLWLATNLSKPEQQLLRDIRNTQVLLPGTVEPAVGSAGSYLVHVFLWANHSFSRCLQQRGIMPCA